MQSTEILADMNGLGSLGRGWNLRHLLKGKKCPSDSEVSVELRIIPEGLSQSPRGCCAGSDGALLPVQFMMPRECDA